MRQETEYQHQHHAGHILAEFTVLVHNDEELAEFAEFLGRFHVKHRKHVSHEHHEASVPAAAATPPVAAIQHTTAGTKVVQHTPAGTAAGTKVVQHTPAGTSNQATPLPPATYEDVLHIAGPMLANRQLEHSAFVALMKQYGGEPAHPPSGANLSLLLMAIKDLAKKAAH
jgi:hypothetical protein